MSHVTKIYTYQSKNTIKTDQISENKKLDKFQGNQKFDFY
jgi:hypothetical protein